MNEKLTALSKLPCIGGPLDGKMNSLSAPFIVCHEVDPQDPNSVKQIVYFVQAIEIDGVHKHFWSCLTPEETLAKVIDRNELSL